MQEINGHKESYSSTRGLHQFMSLFEVLFSLSLITEAVQRLAVSISVSEISGTKLPLDTIWTMQCWIGFSELCFSPPDQSHCYFSCPFFPLCTLHAGRCARFIHILALPFFWNHSSLLLFLFLPSSQCTIQVCLVFIDLYDAQSPLDRSLLHAGNTSFITKILGPLVWNTTAV